MIAAFPFACTIISLLCVLTLGVIYVCRELHKCGRDIDEDKEK